MKGDPKVIDYLNKALRHELTAVNQYWLHYRLLDNWGIKDLAKKWRAESIEEMEHEGVRCSLANLRTFPWVQEREAAGALQLHGAWFAIDQGQLHVLDEERGEFVLA